MNDLASLPSSWSWHGLAIDREREAAHCVELLRDLIRIDTTNPPGNERIAAEFLAEHLRTAGLEPKLIETAKGRACVVTRLRGSGDKPPLLLNAHLDVVPAEAASWRHPPFAAEIHDGYLWGRGAIDMKNMVAMSAVVMMLLARLRAPLERDVIFAGVADEESGCEYGSLYLVQHRPELVRAEYMLGEVGGFSMHLMGRTFYPIQVAEKGVCWVKLRVSGQPGHGSMPNPDSAIVRLADAISTLGHRRFPYRVTPATRQLLEHMAAHLPFPASRLIPLLAHETLGPKLFDVVFKDPARRRSFGALLANTASPTVLSGGSKTNVIPGEATVELDGRTLPGQDTRSFLGELRALVGPDFEFEVMRELPPVVTTPDTPVYRQLAAALRAHDPTAIPLPYIIPSFTDAKAFSKLGTRCYGFSPIRFDPTHEIAFSDLYHGHDERIPVEGLKWGLGVLWDAVTAIALRAQ